MLIIHPFLGGDSGRAVAVKAIGPLWDGNEVWLVTFGGALFAAFPEALARNLTGRLFVEKRRLGN